LSLLPYVVNKDFQNDRSIILQPKPAVF